MELVKLFKSNRFHEIISHFESLSNFNYSDNPFETNILAASYFKSGNFKKAYDLLEMLESVLFNDSEYLSLFGATCRRLMLFDKAKQYFTRAIEINPNSIYHKNNYSNLLIDLGHYQEAIDILESIIILNPDYSDAQENLNRARFALGRTTDLTDLPSSPVTSVSPTLDSTSTPPTFLDPLFIAFSEQEVKEFGRVKNHMKGNSTSHGSLSQQLSLSSDDSISEYLQLAKQAVADQENSQALEYCSQVYQISAPIAPIYSTCSDVYLAQKLFHQAEICILTSLLLSDPTSIQFINLSSLASLRGDLKLAHYYLDRAAALDPSNPNLEKVSSNLRLLSKKKNPFNFNNIWSFSVK